MNTKVVNILFDQCLLDDQVFHENSKAIILFGAKENHDDTMLVNVMAFKCVDEDQHDLERLVKMRIKTVTMLGIAFTSSQSRVYARPRTKKSFFMYLTINDHHVITVEELLLDSESTSNVLTNLITYNSNNLVSSGFLVNPSLRNQYNETVFQFCLDSLRKFSQRSLIVAHQGKLTSCIPELSLPPPPLPQPLTGEGDTEESNKPFKSMVKLLDHTASGRLIRHRLKQIRFFWNHRQDKWYQLKSSNIISLIVMDFLMSLLFMAIITRISSTSHWLEYCLHTMKHIVSNVEDLINSLIGMPAGLKLNGPLNTALGNFFHYHIHIWKTYITLIRPFLTLIIDVLGFLGLIGLTFVLSFFSDLISLASIHIYCFYGYAARLYGFQLSGLIALWRLFRGKKCNTLKKRVDSYSYGHDQLFIGTVCFTILIFLLPTILLYYLVFLFLRLITLFSQIVVKLTIGLINSIPFYGLFLWTIGSKSINTNLTFQIIDSRDRCLRMSTVLKPMPMSQLFVPDNSFDDNPFSFKKLFPSNFVQSLFTGSLL